MARHALPVKGIGRGGDKLFHRLVVAGRAGLWLKGLGGLLTSMAVLTAFGSLVVEILMTINALAVVGILQRWNILECIFFMTLGTRLGFRLNGFIVMACLTVIFGILISVLVMREKRHRGRWMVA